VAAARLADVIAGDPHPLEVGWRGDHFAQQLAVGGLDSGLLGQGQAGLGHPLGKIVAQALERTEIENPRLGHRRRDRAVESHSAERLAEEAGQLLLQMPDLTPQLVTSRQLVDDDVNVKQPVSFE
jgi:hypothetical protein